MAIFGYFLRVFKVICDLKYYRYIYDPLLQPTTGGSCYSCVRTLTGKQEANETKQRKYQERWHDVKDVVCSASWARAAHQCHSE